MKGILRLFIVINFTDEIKDNLSGLVQELKKNTVRGHFTRKENFHLTLAFIGETKDLDHAIESVSNAVLKRKLSPFYLSFGGFGRFKGRDGDIYWIRVEQNPVLTELNKALVNELKHFEFKVDEKEFKPHLTLGRGIVLRQGYSIRDFEKLISPMAMKADRVGLMKSERIAGKLVYTEIYGKDLLKDEL